MVTNIRSQCARNENPPKPEPVRTTALNKRVRANYLNSRKISLTCHSIRQIEPPTTNNAGISTSATPNKHSTAVPKGDRLLNPDRKSSGRLRSPLPSPIPSPTPSPSRNRFHVSRVPESSANSSTSSTQSATTSPMTPPSSSSCSPTSFIPTNQQRNLKSDSKLPAQSSSVPRFSRFSVTTVVETSLPKHKSLPDHLHQSDNSTFHLQTTPPSDPHKTKATTCASSTTTASQTSKDQHLQNQQQPQQPEPPPTQHQAISPQTICSSSLTVTTTGSTKPISVSPPSQADVLTPKSTNNHHLLHSQSQQELTKPSATTNIENVAHHYQHEPHQKPSSASAFSPHVARPALLTPTGKMSTSFDSPDLEVKRFMDDSCSSISSIDSIRGDHPFINTSACTVDSYEPLVAASAHTPIPIVIDKTPLSSTSCGVRTNYDSLSSLETSAGSNDSLFDESTLPGPLPPSSSNEGTLTNSPIGPSSGFTSPSPSSEGERDVSADRSSVKSERRVRKTSWINPITKGESGYPASIDKLLSIFHHPGNFFNRHSTNTPNPSSADESKKEKDTNSDKPPARKESPMSGLFGWSTMTRKEHDPCPDVSCVSQSPPPPSSQSSHAPFQPLAKLQSNTNSIKSPLQPNHSPENTISTSAIAYAQTTGPITTDPFASGSPEHATIATSSATTNCTSTNLIVSIPDCLQKEMKENISPEHTINANSVLSVKSQPQPSPPLSSTITEHSTAQQTITDENPDKVRFELGGDDDDDDEEYDENAAQTQHNFRAFEPSASTSTDTAGSRETSNMKSNQLLDTTSSSNRITGLGQITRDSLSILHGDGSAANSRDSMRSLESLTEIDNNVFQ